MDLIVVSSLMLDDVRSPAINRLRAYSSALSAKNGSLVLTSRFFDLDDSEVIDNGFRLFNRSRLSSPGRAYSILCKQIDFINDYMYCRRLCKRYGESGGESVILVYPNSFSSVLIPIIYFRMYRRMKVIVEKNELEYGVQQSVTSLRGIHGKMVSLMIKPFNLLLGWAADKAASYADGIICISSAMEQFYPRTKTIRIPALSMNHFSSDDMLRQKQGKAFRVVFTGVVSEKKDGVFTFIKVLSELIENGYDICLDLYGIISRADFHLLEKIREKSYLSDRIIFYGNVDSSKVKEVQQNADLLLMLRENNRQNKYGFGTKIAEYLASGVPVLTTDVGDHLLYLRDGENAFVLDSNKLTQSRIKNKMIDILSMSKSDLNGIGRNGRDLAKEHFNLYAYSELLYGFLFA